MTKPMRKDPTLAIQVENLSELAVVECEGRITQSESVFKLRDAVLAQGNSRIIALDLSGVQAIGGGALGMLMFLQHWADDHAIELKLFSPSRSVLEGLVHNRCILDFKIATFHELMGILTQCEGRPALAA